MYATQIVRTLVINIIYNVLVNFFLPRTIMATRTDRSCLLKMQIQASLKHLPDSGGTQIAA